MMFEMVTGQLPFRSKNAPQLMVQLAQGKVPIEWPKQMLPNHVRDLVKQCLNSKPNKRPSAKALLRHPFFLNKLDTMEMSMSTMAAALTNAFSGRNGNRGGHNRTDMSESMLMTEYSMG